jgi:repressor LexA
MKPTTMQGQYLAFIFYYSKINGIAPAESDFVRYFRVTPPSVHQMIITLERNNFIGRTPGKSRSITLKIKHDEIPELE